jgi:hypothetical protein
MQELSSKDKAGPDRKNNETQDGRLVVRRSAKQKHFLEKV